MTLDDKHSRSAQLILSPNKADCVKKAADLKIIEGTGTFKVIAGTVTEFGRAIENHPGASLERRGEFNVDRISKDLRYCAFPVVDIGRDGICDCNAFVVEVATDSCVISDLKLRGVHTKDFSLGVNWEDSRE